MDLQTEEHSKRSLELDALRAIAVFMVLGRHILIIPPDTPAFIKYAALFWRNFGWIGVDLFFVLSGFLVSGLLFKEFKQNNRVSVGRFLVRRMLKLYPAFYVFLILGTPLTYYLLNTAYSTRGILGEIFFFQNYVGSLWLHTWSLAIEEHFYLLLALLIGCSVRFGRSAQPFSFLVPLTLAVTIGLLTARIVVAYKLSYMWSQILIYTHFRIDSLLFGVFLSYLMHFKTGPTEKFFSVYKIPLFILSLVLIAPAFYFSLPHRFIHSVEFTGLYLGFGVLMMLLLLAKSPFKQALLRKIFFLPFLGRHSYSIYLWHVASYVFAAKLIEKFIGSHLMMYVIPVYIALTLMIGVGMSLLIEQPILKLRNRLFPSKSGNLALAAYNLGDKN